MQFRQQLWSIIFVAGLFVLIIAGHRLGQIAPEAGKPISSEMSLVEGSRVFDAAFDPSRSLLSPAAKSALPNPTWNAEIEFDADLSPPTAVAPAFAEVENAAAAETIPAQFDASDAKPLEAEGIAPAAPHALAPTLIAANARKGTAAKPAVDAGRQAPAKITRPDDAAPLTADAIGVKKNTRGPFDELFDEEWPEATREEREIWTQQFRGVAPETVRELLRLRQHHAIEPPRLAGPRLDAADDQFPAREPRRPSVPPPALPHHSPATRHTVALLRQVQAVTLQNLMNAQTPGYKARIVNYADRVPADVFDAAPSNRPMPVPYDEIPDTVASDNSAHTNRPRPSIGIALDQRIDVRPGALRETNRSLDVAIDGPGWFRVTDGDEILYTRNGCLSLTGGRMLALRVAGSHYLLDPPIHVPENVSQIIIKARGEVLGKTEPQIRPEPEPGTATELGSIVVYGFLDESMLTPQAGSLFVPSAASGQAVDLTQRDNTFGALKQGFLEESNVEVNRETERWERLQQFQQMFAELHRTASN